MVKVDTLCLCLRLAPVTLLVAVHCSGGHWATDDEARERALRHGFSVELFPERPLSVLTHMFVHISSQHLLSNLFSLASTLMEFGGEDTMRDNVEEDDVPVVAKRSLASLLVMTVGGIVGGLGGQMLYNQTKVARRREEAERLRAEQRALRRHGTGTASSSRKDRERIVGEPKKGMSKIRKPNMSRLWSDDGSLAAKSLIEHKTGNAGASRKEAKEADSAVAAAALSSASSSPLLADGATVQTAAATQQVAAGTGTAAAVAASASPAAPVRRREVLSLADTYTTNLRERVIKKMRGFIVHDDDDLRDPTSRYASTQRWDSDNEAGDVVTTTTLSSSHGVARDDFSGATDGANEVGNFITRAFKRAQLSAKAWSASKAADAQALLNRNMLMCGASAGVCALSGFNLTYYRRPITALCLALPEMLILANEIMSSCSSEAASSWRTLLPGQTVGHAAHVGGFVVGAGMGLLWRWVAPLRKGNAVRRRTEKARQQREAEERAASQQWRRARPRASEGSETGSYSHAYASHQHSSSGGNGSGVYTY